VERQGIDGFKIIINSGFSRQLLCKSAAQQISGFRYVGAFTPQCGDGMGKNQI
jgi:hypothetical protein